MNSTSRNLFVLAVLILGGVIAYNIGLAISRVGETRVNLGVIPGDSRVTLNNKTVSPGTFYLRPGDYTFKATRSGWSPYEISVRLAKKPLEVGLVPDPASDEAAEYLDNNPDIQLQRESLGGRNSDLVGEQIVARFPIIKALPYEDIYGPFQVDYGLSDKRHGGIFLVVSSSTPPGRMKFLEWLRQQGKDPTDFEIQYNDYTNPFVEGSD